MQQSITIHRRQVSSVDGLVFLAERIKMVHLAKGIGVFPSNLTNYIKGHLDCGRATRLPDKYIAPANEYANSIGQQLMQVRITGDDALRQLKSLGKIISLPYIFQHCMRWEEWRIKERLSDKRRAMYGRFTDSELSEINTHIISLAIQLIEIEIVGTEQKNADEELGDERLVQGACKVSVPE